MRVVAPVQQILPTTTPSQSAGTMAGLAVTTPTCSSAIRPRSAHSLWAKWALDGRSWASRVLTISEPPDRPPQGCRTTSVE